MVNEHIRVTSESLVSWPAMIPDDQEAQQEAQEESNCYGANDDGNSSVIKISPTLVLFSKAPAGDSKGLHLQRNQIDSQLRGN